MIVLVDNRRYARRSSVKMSGVQIINERIPVKRPIELIELVGPNQSKPIDPLNKSKYSIGFG